MKTRLVILAMFAGMISLSSCEKDISGPLDASGNSMFLKDGETTTTSSTSGDGTGGITDGGHGSDYDNTKKKKPAAPGN